MVIFFPLPSRTAVHTTAAPRTVGVPTVVPRSVDTISTSVSSTVAPGSTESFSTLTTSPGETRSCFPPVRTAGIRLAPQFREHGIPHKGLERGKVGQSWRDMRPGMVLLSPGVPGTDWTSLTLQRPIWAFPGVRRPFPTREDFLCYVAAFSG